MSNEEDGSGMELEGENNGAAGVSSDSQLQAEFQKSESQPEDQNSSKATDDDKTDSGGGGCSSMNPTPVSPDGAAES